jgi:hypothetical protein
MGPVGGDDSYEQKQNFTLLMYQDFAIALTGVVVISGA